jgi:ATP-dependent protease Clp ATPase subunit
VDAGFIPELVGRLPVVIVFEPLTTTDLVGIIDHADVSPMATWRHYFDSVFHARLGLDEAAKWVVAERASSLGMGARGLQHVLFPVLSAKATELLGNGDREEVILRASDFLPAAAVRIPTAVR